MTMYTLHVAILPSKPYWFFDVWPVNIMHIHLNSDKAFEFIFASTIISLSLSHLCIFYSTSYDAQSLTHFCMPSKYLCQVQLSVLVFRLICDRIKNVCTCFTKWCFLAADHKDWNCNRCTENPLKHWGTGKDIK